MQKVLSILFSLFLVCSVFGNDYVTIKLRIVKDSVIARGLGTRNEKYYTNFYQYENPKDSIFVKLYVGCGQDGSMDPGIKCRASYEFVDSIADGVYKLIIDDMPIKKVSFVNGKKNGFECTYNQRKRGVNSYIDKRFWFVINYSNGYETEHYKLDKKGNVLEYNPIILDGGTRFSQGINYHFDKKGRLRGISYTEFNFVHDSFTKNGKYAETGKLSEEIRFQNKLSQREIEFIKKIKRSGMVVDKVPNGLAEIKLYDSKYILHFKNGVLLNWQFNDDDSTENIDFNIPSNEIGKYRSDLLNFCKN